MFWLFEVVHWITDCGSHFAKIILHATDQNLGFTANTVSTLVLNPTFARAGCTRPHVLLCIDIHAPRNFVILAQGKIRFNTLLQSILLHQRIQLGRKGRPGLRACRFQLQRRQRGRKLRVHGCMVHHRRDAHFEVLRHMVVSGSSAQHHQRDFCMELDRNDQREHRGLGLCTHRNRPGKCRASKPWPDEPHREFALCRPRRRVDEQAAMRKWRRGNARARVTGWDPAV